MPKQSPAQASDSYRHKRTYRACTECRSAKLRCDLGDADAPRDPPCRRCRRTGRSCQFAESYNRTYAPRSARPKRANEMAHEMYGPEPQRDSAAAALDRPNMDHLERVYDGELDKPADALRLLSSVADDRTQFSKSQDRPTPPETLSSDEVWNRWPPVREGLLTASEASSLINFYARHINPCHPIVTVELFAPDNLSMLLQEASLVGAMACVAARYADLGQSFDPREPSRSKVVQVRLVDWLLKRIAFWTMGSRSMRTIGTVETLLILSEWPPRLMLVEDNVFPLGERIVSACKHQDDVAWTNVALAVRIAQEIGLNDETTYEPRTTSSWQARRRINAWIQCMSADQHISGRLGRDALVSTKMAASWWDRFFVMSCETTDAVHPLPRSRPFWRASRVNAEHAHVIAICHQTLYPSPSATADLITTGRFQSFLDRLKPELDHLWAWATGDETAYNLYDGPGHLAPDLQRILWRIDHDYVRLYANAIAMRAAVSRLLRSGTFDAPGPQARARGRVMAVTAIVSVEGVQMIEAVESALALLRHGVECHKRNVLRYCPGRTFQRILFAAVFLMKAMTHGAVAEKEPAVLDLQHQILTCFREAAVDEEHIASEIAALLERVFPTLTTASAPTSVLQPSAETRASAPEERATTQSNTSAGYDDLVLLPAPDYSMTFDAGQDMFANWGFDPVILLNEMDAVIQANEGEGVR